MERFHHDSKFCECDLYQFSTVAAVLYHYMWAIYPKHFQHSSMGLWVVWDGLGRFCTVGDNSKFK